MSEGFCLQPPSVPSSNIFPQKIVRGSPSQCRATVSRLPDCSRVSEAVVVAALCSREAHGRIEISNSRHHSIQSHSHSHSHSHSILLPSNKCARECNDGRLADTLFLAGGFSEQPSTSSPCCCFCNCQWSIFESIALPLLLCIGNG